jgi:LacI family transcriptional regulator
MNVVHITPLSIKLVMYQKSGRILTETPLITALMAGVESEGRVHKLDTIIYTIKEDENDFHSKINSLLKERNSGIILLATELGWDDVKNLQK